MDASQLAAQRSLAKLFAIAFVFLGVFAGFAMFGSGSLLGVVGARLTKRLRLLVFTNLMCQDGEFFDFCG